MKPIRWRLGILLYLLLFINCTHKSKTVDLIIHNAVVYTLDQDNTIADAIAIKDGKIVEVGAERHILNKYKSAKTMDMQKRPVYPGFIDAHCHFIAMGSTLMQLNLSTCKSFDHALERTENYAKKTSSYWVVGQGWDENKWEGKVLPEKSKLDGLFPDRPVFLKRIDLHQGIANQVALDKAGINKESDFQLGEVEIKAGELTGIVKDGAYNKILSVIPPNSVEETRAAIMAAQKDCFKYGLTTVDDAMMKKHEAELIAEMQEEGELKIRIYAMLEDSESNFSNYLNGGPKKSERLNLGAFKFFLDGALGSRGAYLFEPYSDSSSEKGILMYEKEELLKKAKLLKDNGWQMCTHSIGDSANSMILDVYNEVLGESTEYRWRVEHAQMVRPQDLEKFKYSMVIPSIQPTHAISDMAWVRNRIGDRVSYSYAYNDLLEQVGLLSIGTDFPVEGVNPVMSFYTAVFRCHPDDPESVFNPENKISREEAIRGMTIWAAWSNFEDEEKGTIEPGKYADLTVLDRDILKIEQKFIPDTKVLLTIIGGEVVYQGE